MLLQNAQRAIWVSAGVLRLSRKIRAAFALIQTGQALLSRACERTFSWPNNSEAIRSRGIGRQVDDNEGARCDRIVGGRRCTSSLNGPRSPVIKNSGISYERPSTQEKVTLVEGEVR